MKKLSLSLFSIILFSSIITSAISFEKIILGKAYVTDGDTIKINDQKIRLFGIDAPETKQFCKEVYLSFLIILLKLILNLSFQKNIVFKFDNTSKPNWPHKEIIEQVSNLSPYSKSLIAILPDTKELNTFNLSSEANMQNSNTYVRQIISNEKSYKDDLDRFNWFLLKDGDQGVMSNNSKLKLSNLIEGSNKFQNFRSWELPDGSQATLYKRKIINESISIINKNLIPLNLDLIFSSHLCTHQVWGKHGKRACR